MTQRETAQPLEREIAHWLRLLAGDGITDSDLFVAAVNLRMALRQQKQEIDHENLPRWQDYGLGMAEQHC